MNKIIRYDRFIFLNSKILAEIYDGKNYSRLIYDFDVTTQTDTQMSRSESNRTEHYRNIPQSHRDHVAVEACTDELVM